MPSQLAQFHILCNIATGVSLVVAFFGGFLLFYNFFYASFFVAFAAFIIGMVPGLFLMLCCEGFFYIYKNHKAYEKSIELQEETNKLLKEIIQLNNNSNQKSNEEFLITKENDAI